MHLKRFFDNAGLPATKPRDSAPVNPVFFANCFGANLFGLFYYRQRLFFAKAAWFAGIGRDLRNPNFFPTKIAGRINPVGGTSLLDTILVSLFENSEFLLGRELLSRFDPTDRFAPIAVTLITDLVFGTDVFNTGLLALFSIASFCSLLKGTRVLILGITTPRLNVNCCLAA